MWKISKAVLPKVASYENKPAAEMPELDSVALDFEQEKARCRRCIALQCLKTMLLCLLISTIFNIF